MNARVPAEAFPPGDFLREELEARQWSQQGLADILDRPPRLISELLAGKRAITPETALGLSQAFGSSPEYWLNLESQYQLSKLKAPDDRVSRKARLYTKFPVREMLRRNWVLPSENLDVLENRFCKFFETESIEQSPELCHVAKKPSATSEATPLELAWLFRVKAMALQQKVPDYSRKKLIGAISELKELLCTPGEVRHVPEILAQAGVRFVLVEPIGGTKMDGACFWLDDNEPVIGMTLRFDRIDNFWFVLRHEVEHVLREDGKQSGGIIDADVDGSIDGLPKCELLANRAAADFCVPTEFLDSFIAEVQPYFTDQRIKIFAQRMRVHPALVAGQLRRRLGRNASSRKHQVRVRGELASSACTDGWGLFPK